MLRVIPPALALVALCCSAEVSALPALPEDLLGHWRNQEASGELGLVIRADKNCDIYTQQPNQPRSTRGCKVEFYADTTYFVYLKGADGKCATDPDFEFRYLQADKRLDLDVGNGGRFLLQK
jgi:transposase InsO family protein